MAKRIVNQADYTFSAAAKTVTFSASYTGLELGHVELITNVASNILLYQFNKPGRGGSLVGLVLTLDYDTTAMSDADPLQIFVESELFPNDVYVANLPPLYTEGDVDTSISGTAVLWEDVGNTLRPVSDIYPLPVEIIAGSAASTEYTEGDVDASLTGVVSMMEGAGNTVVPVQGTVADGVLVNLGANNDVVISGTVPVTDNGGSLTVDGAVSITGTPTVELGASSLAAFDTVTIANGPGGAAVNIQDGGNSITVDGAVSATQSGTWILGANSGVDVGDVTINNASGAGAVNIQDGGNSITIDATSLPLPTGAATAANQTTQTTALQLLDDVVATDGSAALTKLYQVGGTDGTNAQILSTNTSGHLNIADGGNSITVDGTVSAAQSGTWNITNVTGTVSLPTGAATAANQATQTTALQLLDDVVATTATAALTKLYQVGGTDGTNARIMSTTTAGHVNIADGGNSITVDGSVSITGTPTVAVSSIAAGTNYVGKTRLTDGTTDAEVIPLTNYNAQAVAVVDGSGNQITSFGASTQYTEGDTDTTITGTAMLFETNTGTSTLGVVSSANPLPISDNGGSVTVDGTVTANAGTGFPSAITNGGSGVGALGVPIMGINSTTLRTLAVDATGTLQANVTQSGTWSTRVNDAAGNAVTSIAAGGQRGLAVAVIDSSGTQLSSSGFKNTEYTEGDVDTTISGQAMLFEGAGNTLVPAQGTAADGLLVNLGANNDVVVSDGGGSITVDGAVTISGTPTVDTELPAAAVLADNSANPTAPGVAAFGMVFDGATWDRMPGTSGTGVLVNTGANQVQVTGPGGLEVDVDTELPPAGLLSTSIDPPTTSTIGSFPYVWNGTKWVFTPGTATGASVVITGQDVILDTNISDGGGSITVDDGGGSITVDGTVAVTDGLNIEGDVAHDAADSGNPLKIGAKAIAHGANPTAVAAADRTDLYANRHGVLFTIGGHPNTQTLRAHYTAAQTDTAIVTVSSGTKIVVTRCTITTDHATSIDVFAIIGFGATTTPTTSGVVLSHPGIAPGSGVREGSGSGILGIGGDGEDLRITCEAPTDGSIDVVVSYYTIES